MLTCWFKVDSQICQEIMNWIYKNTYLNAKTSYALAFNKNNL